MDLSSSVVGKVKLLVQLSPIKIIQGPLFFFEKRNGHPSKEPDKRNQRQGRDR
jgi:hypothetical protein